MSGNYSCFDVPLDLSLTGASVSPTRKSRPTSARSSTSSVKATSSRQYSINTRPKSSVAPAKQNQSKKVIPNKEKSSLAMTFPSKQRKPLQQANATQPVSEDYLDSFFKQSRSKARSTRSSSSYSKQKSKYEDRVFKIPDTARSDSIYSDGNLSTQSSLQLDRNSNSEISLEHRSGSGDADVDYLKSYLSNMNKYKDISSGNDEYHPGSSSRASLTSSHLPSSHLPSTKDPKEPSLDPFQDKNIKRFRENRSARKIQAWYRRHSTRLKRNKAVMKRMLAEKKEDMENSVLRESLHLNSRTEEEKRKQREQRERDARKKAIKELQEKRNAEKERVRKIAEEEVEEVKKKVEAEKKKLSRSRASSKASDVSMKARRSKKDVVVSPLPMRSEIIRDESETQIRKEESNPVPEAADSNATGDTLRSAVTLDDVLETIKRLEEEPQHLEKPKSAMDEKLSWIDDLQEELQSNISKASKHSSSTALTMTDSSALLTKAKLQSISSYLDVLETKKDHPVARLDETDAEEHLKEAEQTATEVTSQMLKVKLALEEKTRSVKLLQDALTQQREMSFRQNKEHEEEFNKHLKVQKDQYEAAIQRHLSFIDQLIDDKKALNEKCEKLVMEMKQTEGKYQKKIKTMSDSHQAEMQKSKDILAASEKIRREKWIDEKTKKIKEMTVKGLEPEIQRLIAKHKEEMKKVKAIHEAELLRSDERAGQRYIRQTEELREQLEREKEAACGREREMARQRYEKQMEQEEIALQQQRKRLYAEVAEEKERLNQQVVRQRKELDELKQQIEANSRIASSTLRDEFEKSAEEMQKRHQEDMKSLRERVEVEKQAWQENYMKKQEAFMMQKERELKEAVRRDRDNEIDAAILRLEDEMHHQREELEKTTENRIKRIRDKYEAEMREVERSEKQTQEKYNAMKSEFNEMESENIRLQSVCKQKEQDVADMLKIKTKLVEERGNVSDVIRQEFADRLVITDEENKRMKNELSELRARQRLELERINNEKEEELAEVHKRVRNAIVKKEEIIFEIRQQYDAALKRAEHLESLLEQQRKKLIGKKK